MIFESCTMKSTWYFAKIAQVEELLYLITNRFLVPTGGMVFESCTMKSTWYFAKIAQVEEQAAPWKNRGCFFE
jgi:hypothetical protein